MWQLVRTIEDVRKPQRIAPAPVHDALGTVASDKHTHLIVGATILSIISGNVVGVSQSQAHVVLCGRREQAGLACKPAPTY